MYVVSGVSTVQRLAWMAASNSYLSRISGYHTSPLAGACSQASLLLVLGKIVGFYAKSRFWFGLDFWKTVISIWILKIVTAPVMKFVYLFSEVAQGLRYSLW